MIAEPTMTEKPPSGADQDLGTIEIKTEKEITTQEIPELIWKIIEAGLMNNITIITLLCPYLMRF